MSVVLDGRALAQTVRAEVATRAAALRDHAVVPTLAVVLVGDDPASHVYVRAKEKAARDAGVEPRDHRLPATVSQAELLGLIAALNQDPTVHGILVQLPLPRGLSSDAVIMAIAPHKDVDGLHPTNTGLLAQGRPGFVACTPAGCMRLLASAAVPLAGARAVVIGRSVLVGKPVAMLLTNAGATVTLCHSQTRALPDDVARADIVIAAVGRPQFVQPHWLRSGASVIDVGINRMPDGTLVGDVHPDGQARAGVWTPVPGGVGPMTIACLLHNTVQAAEWHAGRGATSSPFAIAP